MLRPQNGHYRPALVDLAAERDCDHSEWLYVAAAELSPAETTEC
jgi:hypothetical protein